MTAIDSRFVSHDIPVEVRSFYDPNKFFASSDNSEDALLSWVDRQRQVPVALPYIGAVATRQLVAMELAHVGMIDEENAHAQDWLGLPTAAIEQAVEATRRTATDTAEFCLAAVSQVRKNRSRQALFDTSDITLAGAVLGAKAHQGQERVNGNKPYYTHPRAVALLVDRAYQVHFSNAPNEERAFNNLKSLLHDGCLEDAFPKDGRSFLTSQRLIPSPRVIYETLRMIGYDAQTARQHAIGMLGLTKTVGPDGSMEYDTMIERFKYYREEIPIKVGDMQHNKKIDPKELLLGNDPETERKNHNMFVRKNQYTDGQQKLVQMYGEGEFANPTARVRRLMFVDLITKLTRDDLLQEQQRTEWAKIEPIELTKAFDAAA